MRGVEPGPAATVPEWLRPLVDALPHVTGEQLSRFTPPDTGGRHSAVLVLFGEGPSGPDVLLIERGHTLRSHAGQPAFPGGALDPDDGDPAGDGPVAAALREAEEEVGLHRSGVEVLGLLPPAHVAVSGFDVTTVVAWWREPAPLTALDVREVASAPVVPVAVLTDPARRASVRHPSGYTGPAFEVPGHLIWGLTAHLLDGVLDLGGWQRPWDRRREVPIPARYLAPRREPDRPDPGGPDAH